MSVFHAEDDDRAGSGRQDCTPAVEFARAAPLLPAKKVLLLHLARWAGPDGRGILPVSIGALRGVLGVSRVTVLRYLAGLAREGYVREARRAGEDAGQDPPLSLDGRLVVYDVAASEETRVRWQQSARTGPAVGGDRASSRESAGPVKSWAGVYPLPGTGPVPPEGVLVLAVLFSGKSFVRAGVAPDLRAWLRHRAGEGVAFDRWEAWPASDPVAAAAEAAEMNRAAQAGPEDPA